MSEFETERKEVSISEFFDKNKQMLGFDSPQKSLFMTVKEAVDNSLDACADSGILPEITVRIEERGKEKFRIEIIDNGPGSRGQKWRILWKRCSMDPDFPGETIKGTTGTRNIGSYIICSKDHWNSN